VLDIPALEGLAVDDGLIAVDDVDTRVRLLIDDVEKLLPARRRLRADALVELAALGDATGREEGRDGERHRSAKQAELLHGSDSFLVQDGSF
jgi:hypothetical protein